MTSSHLSISVLTVVRNDPDGLAATIASVNAYRRHGRHAIRFVVVDGASNDDTQLVLQRHRADFDAWVSESDAGIYDAMNKAARLAEPDTFLIWINAGDLLLDLDALDVQAMADVDAVYAAIRLPNGTVIEPNIRIPYNASSCYPKTIMRHQGFMIRREAFFRLGGYRLDVGLQAEGLLMSQAIMTLRWTNSDVPLADFKLDGVSNKRHWATLVSYLRVTRELGMSTFAILIGQRIFLTKLMMKVVLPDAITSRIISRRWGE